MIMQKIPKILLYVTAGLGLVVIVLLAFMAGHYLQPQQPVSNVNNQNSNTTNTANLNTNSDTTNSTVNTNSNNARMAVGEDGVTWLAAPEELSDLGLFKNQVGVHYYLVGNTEDGGQVQGVG